MLRRFLALLLLLLPIAGGAAAAASIVGKWIQIEEGVTVTFRDDGGLTIETADGRQEGTWSVSESSLTLVLKPPGAEQALTLTCIFAIAGDDLTITPGDAKCGDVRFKRAG